MTNYSYLANGVQRGSATVGYFFHALLKQSRIGEDNKWLMVNG